MAEPIGPTNPPELPTDTPPSVDFDQVFKSDVFQSQSRPAQYEWIGRHIPAFKAARPAAQDAWYERRVTPNLKPKSQGVLASVAAGVNEAIPTEALKAIYNVFAHPFDPNAVGPMDIAQGFIGSHWEEAKKGWAAGKRASQALESGEYGQMANEFLDAFSHDLAAVVPGIGPGLMHAMEEVEAGKKSGNKDLVTQGYSNAAAQLLLALVPGGKGKGKPSSIARAPEVEAIGIDPTLTETMKGKVGQMAQSADPKLARMIGAEKVAEPFMIKREAQVERAAQAPAKALAPTPAPEVPSRIVQGAAPKAAQDIAAERLGQAEAAIPTPVLYEQGENVATDAMRGNERAAARVESQAWGPLKREAGGIQVRVQPLVELVRGFAQLQQSARNLIMESVPTPVYSLLARVASRPEITASQRAVLEGFARQFGYNSLAEATAEAPEFTSLVRGQVGELAPETVPWNVVHEARQGIGKAREAVIQHAKRTGQDQNSVRILTRTYATLTGMLRNSLPASGPPGMFGAEPGLRERFDIANGITRARRGLYIRPDVVRGIIYGEPGELRSLYDDLLKGGGKPRTRIAIVNALRANSNAMATFRDGLTEYVVRNSMETGDTGPRLNYEKALRAIDPRRVPGVRELMGPARHEELVKTLEEAQRKARDPETLRYQAFLRSITTAQDSTTAIRNIWKNPDALERAIRMTANDPELKAHLAGSLYGLAVEDASGTGVHGKVIDSKELSNNLKTVTPVIERVMGPDAAAPFVKESVKLQRGLDRMSLPTAKAYPGGSGYQVYYLMHALAAFATARYLGAIRTGMLMAVPALYTAINVAPRSLRVVKELGSMTGTNMATGAAGLAVLPKNASIPIMRRASKPGSDPVEGKITDAEAARLTAAGYTVETVQ